MIHSIKMAQKTCNHSLKKFVVICQDMMSFTTLDKQRSINLCDKDFKQVKLQVSTTFNKINWDILCPSSIK